MISLKKRDFELVSKIEADKLLDSTFNFCDPHTFFEEGIKLFDINGEPIPSDLPKESPRVLVYLDDAVSHWQFLLKDIVHAAIKKYDTAKDALMAVGLTDLFARPLSNVEALGLDAAITGNKATADAWEFANELKVPKNTAHLYLQIKGHTNRNSRLRAAGFLTDEPEQGRSYEEAVKLFQAIATTSRSTKAAGSKYIISVINSYAGLFTLDEILEVLSQVSYEEGEEMRLSKCDNKENCIHGVLDPYFKELKNKH